MASVPACLCCIYQSIIRSVNQSFGRSIRLHISKYVRIPQHEGGPGVRSINRSINRSIDRDATLVAAPYTLHHEPNDTTRMNERPNERFELCAVVPTSPFHLRLWRLFQRVYVVSTNQSFDRSINHSNSYTYPNTSGYHSMKVARGYDQSIDLSIDLSVGRSIKLLISKSVRIPRHEGGPGFGRSIDQSNNQSIN